MKRKKLTVVVLIFSLIFIFAGIAGSIVLNTFSIKLTEENTTEYTATVINVEVKDGNGRIYTEEFGDKLYFRPDYVDVNAFNSLQAGQTVFFSIENIWLEQFEETSFIYIVSLKTEEKEIFSLTSYNEHMEHERSMGTIFCIVFIPILLLVFIHCVLLLKGINVLHRGAR